MLSFKLSLFVGTRKQILLCLNYFANEPTIKCKWILMKPN